MSDIDLWYFLIYDIYEWYRFVIFMSDFDIWCLWVMGDLWVILICDIYEWYWCVIFMGDIDMWYLWVILIFDIYEWYLSREVMLS